VPNGSAWSDLALESHLKPVLADVFSREIQRRTHNYFARLREHAYLSHAGNVHGLVHAIHVMEGATALADKNALANAPPGGPAAPHSAFTVKHNYVALPQSEAFRIDLNVTANYLLTDAASAASAK